MATTAPLALTQSATRAVNRPRIALSWLFAAGWPLGLFGLVNLGAEALGILPLYFSPFGLPGWVGAAAHLAQLGMLGGAFLALTHKGQEGSARHWLTGFILAYIALPFITPPLDSLQLSLVCTSLFVVGFASAIRVAAVSKLAAGLMALPLAILGLSATMGLALAAAFTPPFALVQGQQAAL
jgi:hypothetical protein